MSQTNDINTLRDALFSTLAALQNKTKPLDIERARAINETSQVIINSVKAETDHIKAIGAHHGSGFIRTPEGQPALPNHSTTQTGTGTKTTTPVIGGSVTSHRTR